MLISIMSQWRSWTYYITADLLKQSTTFSFRFLRPFYTSHVFCMQGLDSPGSAQQVCSLRYKSGPNTRIVVRLTATSSSLSTFLSGLASPYIADISISMISACLIALCNSRACVMPWKTGGAAFQQMAICRKFPGGTSISHYGQNVMSVSLMLVLNPLLLNREYVVWLRSFLCVISM
jgi:hypothetical protein